MRAGSRGCDPANTPMNRVLPHLLLAVAAFCIQGCGHEEKPHNAVAAVDGEILTTDELVEYVPPEFRGDVTLEQWLSIVGEWVDDVLLANYALSRGAEDDPETARKLAAARRKILVEFLRQKLVAPTIKVSERDVELYYRSHQGDFVREHDEVHALHIIVPDKATADTVKKLLAAGEPFCQVARRFSREFSEKDSCDIGWFGKADILPSLVRPVFRAGVGEVVGPLRTQNGYHFFFVVDKKPAGTVRSLGEVYEKIRQRIFEERFGEALRNLVDSLRAAAKVEIDTQVIRRISKR